METETLNTLFAQGLGLLALYACACVGCWRLLWLLDTRGRLSLTQAIVFSLLWPLTFAVIFLVYPLTSGTEEVDRRYEAAREVKVRRSRVREAREAEEKDRWEQAESLALKDLELELRGEHYRSRDPEPSAPLGIPEGTREWWDRRRAGR